MIEGRSPPHVPAHRRRRVVYAGLDACWSEPATGCGAGEASPLGRLIEFRRRGSPTVPLPLVGLGPRLRAERPGAGLARWREHVGLPALQGPVPERHDPRAIVTED